MSISKAFMTAVSKMDNATLSQLQSLINERKTEIAYEVRSEIKVGDSVKVNHKKLAGLIGTISEIRRSRATVKINGTFRSFNVPLTLIIPVKLSKAQMESNRKLAEAAAEAFTKWG
jgi:transcription antitermination factor NusG